MIAAAVLGLALVLIMIAVRAPLESPLSQGAPTNPISLEDVDEIVDSSSEPAESAGEQAVADETQEGSAADRLSCPEPADPTEMDFAAMAEVLKHSDDPEHLLMATMYGGARRRSEGSPFPAESNLDALFTGLEIEPRNELLLWNAMALCARTGEQDRCDDYNVPALATTVLGNNANFWFRLAAIRLDADDTDGAYTALRRSLDAPEYNEYFIEHVELFARGLAAFNNAPYNERVVAGFGLAAALHGAEGDVLLACQEHAPTSSKWLAVCMTVGERMEVSGRTMMTEMLGLGLQKSMFEIAGDDQRARTAEMRINGRRRFLDEMLIIDEQLVVLSYDERVLESYIDTWKAFGERQAMLYLQRETHRLMNTPGYQPCAAAVN